MKLTDLEKPIERLIVQAVTIEILGRPQVDKAKAELLQAILALMEQQIVDGRLSGWERILGKDIDKFLANNENDWIEIPSVWIEARLTKLKKVLGKNDE